MKTKETIETLAANYNRKNNDLFGEKKGGAGLACLALLATPVLAYGFSYVGEGFGWVGGHLIDFIPYARDVAPWLAKRSGLVKDVQDITNFNVHFYQASTSVSAFWGGLIAGVKLALIGGTVD